MSALNYEFLVQPTRVEGKNFYCVVKCVIKSQSAQAHYLWVRASEVIWSEYTSIISVLSDA